MPATNDTDVESNDVPTRGPATDSHRHANPLWWMRWVPAALIVLVVGWLLYVFGSVALVPVLASFAIAYLLHPLVMRLEAWGLSRSLAAVLAMLVVGGAVVALFAFVIPGLWHETLDAGREVTAKLSPENIGRLRERLASISPALDRAAGPRLEAIARDPSSLLSTVSWWFAGAFTGVLS
ncbi:MAG TPA: AI-2E family transporter, partial [Luteitalea sp.]|nr:AI-2E family transporter [Luteitalea sp.]